MTLRTIVLGACLIALLLSIWLMMFSSDHWPTVAMLAGLSALLAYERQHYGARQSRPGEGNWRETEEQFVDDATGQLVRVWFNPETGARRYVAVEQDHSSK